MGATGYKLIGALADLLPDKQPFIQSMNSLGLPGISFSAQDAVMYGVSGTRISIKSGGKERSKGSPHSYHSFHGSDDKSESEEHHHSHSHHRRKKKWYDIFGIFSKHSGDSHSHSGHHSHSEHHSHTEHHSHSESGGYKKLSDLKTSIDSLELSEKVKKDITDVYMIIAEAYGKAHGVAPEQVRFYELGENDAVAEIAGFCLLMDMLAPENVVVSPVRLGFGHVYTAQGALPIPSPETSYILLGLPTYGGHIEGELCSCIGAALLKKYADDFNDMPLMKTERIGCGLGRQELEKANCVRTFLGESADELKTPAAKEQGSIYISGRSTQQTYSLVCVLKETPEKAAEAAEMLTASGAAEAYTTLSADSRKKRKPVLTCICGEDKREEMKKLIFSNTSAVRITEHICSEIIK